MVKWLTFVACVWMLALGTGWYAHAGTSGNVGRSPVRVHIDARCLGAEDSAGHLRLRAFGSGVAVYGCYRTGY